MGHSGASCGLLAIPSLRPSAFTLRDRYGNEDPTHCQHTKEQLHKFESPHNNIMMRTVLSERQPLAQLFEAPAWAVPAKGETRLEPVCEGVRLQASVDLTIKSLYRIGRSPHCDVQLLHGTSSRRHALLFHHSNGSCYLVDCGSAHGTYVNGRRISSPSNGGVVVPYKVRRGAMIRFGGPGAPCFVLKSFSFKLDEVSKNEDENKPDMGELVRRNTRLNALGSSAAESVRGFMKFSPLDDLAVHRKRSFDSLSTSATLDEDFEHPAFKRLRCTSPPTSVDSSPLRLVSPDLVKRHVRFSADPPQAFHFALVTPECSLSV